MDNSASEDFAECEASGHEAPQNNWTDEDTNVEKAGMWEAVFNDEDGFPADYSVDMDDPEWDVSLGLELGDMEPDEREKSNMDSTRMFKLRSGCGPSHTFFF
ncbi:hypothetical protein AMELA_G00288080, partial [Ameiurus melas]